MKQHRLTLMDFKVTVDAQGGFMHGPALEPGSSQILNGIQADAGRIMRAALVQSELPLLSSALTGVSTLYKGMLREHIDPSDGCLRGICQFAREAQDRSDRRARAHICRGAMVPQAGVRLQAVRVAEVADAARQRAWTAGNCGHIELHQH